jgi:uncharacterized protein
MNLLTQPTTVSRDHAMAGEGAAPLPLVRAVAPPEVDAQRKADFARHQQAAAAGDPEAWNQLGRCYEYGWGTPVDLSAAAGHYLRAADAGHAWAQYHTGQLYLDGRGVERDAFVALAYLNRAAEQRHARAMNLIGRCCEEGWGTAKSLGAAAAWYLRAATRGLVRGQFNWATTLLKAGQADEAAEWLELAARGGTPAVRDAVIRLASQDKAPGALKAMAGRLQAG